VLLPRAIQRAAALALLRLPPKALRRIVGPPRMSPDGFEMDLQSQALLWLLRAVREPEGYAGDLRSARRRLDIGSRVLALPDPGGVRFEDCTVPGGAGERRARIYAPSAEGRPLPALVWFHGGGFVLGSIESHHEVCRELARQAGVIVLSVDYRLAPEHPFPAGLEDAIAATRWVLWEGATLGIDSGAVAVGGDSAGGNLATGTARALRDEARRPVFQLLVYPPTDATCAQPSQAFFDKGFILTAANIQWFLGHYVTDRAQVTDPRVSPLFAPDLSGLPPAQVITAGFDPLRDEGRAYARRLKDAGVEVDDLCSEGSLHGFLCTAGAIRESAEIMARAADALKAALSLKCGKP
jgi:acetyl esterase